MFPNVRLLIGALFITILVLSCEFGVFAALRVSREPLSRLTSESAPLQLVTGKNALSPVPVSWSVPRITPAPVDAEKIGLASVDAAAAHRAERALETPAPSNDGADDDAKNDSQPSPAALQAAIAASPAAPPPFAPVAGAAAPLAQAPIPPPANSSLPANEAIPANSDPSGAEAQQVRGPTIGVTAGNAAPEQAAAAAAALTASPLQQTPVAEIMKPAAPQPAQADPAPQPHETAAQANKPPANSAPIIAAIAPVAAEPAAAEPAEVTGSLSNGAVPEKAPEAAAPKAKAPHAKPVSKIVRKPAAKKPHKVARAPVPSPHPIKKHIARRARSPAAASSAQPANTFENPVFQSAPQFQQPARSRAANRNTATNNGFGHTFGANAFGGQLSPQ